MAHFPFFKHPVPKSAHESDEWKGKIILISLSQGPMILSVHRHPLARSKLASSKIYHHGGHGTPSSSGPLEEFRTNFPKKVDCSVQTAKWPQSTVLNSLPIHSKSIFLRQLASKPLDGPVDANLVRGTKIDG